MIDEVARSFSPAATSRASAARGPAHVSAASDPARPAATGAGAADARPRPRAAADGDSVNTGPPPAVWDLAIVGGGPAGAIAAWRAAHLGLRAVLLERGGFPRDKVCGEFISAEALPLLAQVTPALVTGAPQIGRANWITAHGRRAGFQLASPGRGIARWDLDAALWAAAGQAGVELRAGVTVTRWRPSLGQLEYRGLGAGGAETLQARALVLAAGRWWRIQGLASPGMGGEGAPVRGLARGRGDGRQERAGSPERGAFRRGTRWVGVKAHLQGVRCEGLEMFAFPGGYCGLAPVAGGVNACALAGDGRAMLAGCRDFVAWLRSRSAPLAVRLSTARLARPVQMTAPVWLGLRSQAPSGVFCVGDAAGFADPFTGSGLARALLGGALAAEFAASALISGGDLAGALAAHAAAVDAATRRARRCSHWLRSWMTAAEPWQGWAARLLTAGTIGRALETRTRWDQVAVTAASARWTAAARSRTAPPRRQPRR